MKGRNLGLRLIAGIAFLFIVSPIIASFIKVGWASLPAQFGAIRSALALTLVTSLLSALLATILGVPLAWYLTIGSKRFTNLIRPVIFAPIIMPPTVTGIALLMLMGRQGVLGKPLYDLTGWSMPFTSSAVVFAGTYVGLPFFVLICENALRNIPKEIEYAGALDGAGPAQVLQYLWLPMTRSTLFTGSLLAWARAVGEFGATIMFAGSFPGVTQTVTMLIYQQTDVSLPDALSTSSILLVFSLSIVFLLRKQLLLAIGRG